MRDRKLNPRIPALLLAVSALAFQIGCATAALRAHHPAFTADRVLGLKVGITADSVVSLFGRPDRTQAMTCGSQTSSPWQCLIWEYDMGPHPRGRYQHSNNTNSFTFSAESNPPRLNNWNIDLMYDSPQP
jgi:hypothetical protein